MDKYELLYNAIKKGSYGSSEVKTLIGDELGENNLGGCALVFSEYNAGECLGHIGVLGPARMRYESVVPAVKYTKNLVTELCSNWK